MDSKKGFLIFLIGLILTGPAFCGDPIFEEEMAILRMYYDEKDLVIESATRSPKSISQAAENISVITARELEAMNAHTLAEALKRIPGIFVEPSTSDFCAAATLSIQGSERRHVLVLVDGFVWNPLSSGAVTNAIPVGIIERIEIIKGPGSSVWGSSIGGVINIITKTGETDGVSGRVRGSYGKSNSQDYRAELRGRTGRLGYYLFAGHQTSDGLTATRSFDNNIFYSKLDFSVSPGTDIGVSAGYTEPFTGLGDYPGFDMTISVENENFFVNAFLNSEITDNLNFDLSVHTLKVKFWEDNLTMGLGIYGDTPGELFSKSVYDDQYTGISAKTVWKKGIHNIVLGGDYEHLAMDLTVHSGDLYQSAGAPKIIHASPDVDRWAVYVNDTITIGNFSLTPGIRYDYNDINGSFVSPSLGITYKMGETTIFRAAGSRGFSTPHIEALSAGGRWIKPNPSLDSEEVFSYQVGVETGAAKYVWAKATLFYHDMENELYRTYIDDSDDRIYLNREGHVRRRGGEIELETLPVYNMSLFSGFAYVNIDPKADSGTEDLYTYNIGVRYDDKESLRAEIFGHYIWWNIDPSYEGKYDDFLWNLNLSKRINIQEQITADLFLTVHNIFNGSQYYLGESKNPERWMEAGIRFKF